MSGGVSSIGVALTRLVMSDHRNPFETFNFGQEMASLADLYLTANGPDSAECLRRMLLN